MTKHDASSEGKTNVTDPPITQPGNWGSDNKSKSGSPPSASWGLSEKTKVTSPPVSTTGDKDIHETDKTKDSYVPPHMRWMYRDSAKTSTAVDEKESSKVEEKKGSTIDEKKVSTNVEKKISGIDEKKTPVADEKKTPVVDEKTTAIVEKTSPTDQPIVSKVDEQKGPTMIAEHKGSNENEQETSKVDGPKKSKTDVPQKSKIDEPNKSKIDAMKEFQVKAARTTHLPPHIRYAQGVPKSTAGGDNHKHSEKSTGTSPPDVPRVHNVQQEGSKNPASNDEKKDNKESSGITSHEPLQTDKPKESAAKNQQEGSKDHTHKSTHVPPHQRFAKQNEPKETVVQGKKEGSKDPATGSSTPPYLVAKQGDLKKAVVEKQGEVPKGDDDKHKHIPPHERYAKQLESKETVTKGPEDGPKKATVKSGEDTLKSAAEKTPHIPPHERFAKLNKFKEAIKRGQSGGPKTTTRKTARNEVKQPTATKQQNQKHSDGNEQHKDAKKAAVTDQQQVSKNPTDNSDKKAARLATYSFQKDQTQKQPKRSLTEDARAILAAQAGAFLESHGSNKAKPMPWPEALRAATQNVENKPLPDDEHDEEVKEMIREMTEDVESPEEDWRQYYQSLLPSHMQHIKKPVYWRERMAKEKAKREDEEYERRKALGLLPDPKDPFKGTALKFRWPTTDRTSAEFIKKEHARKYDYLPLPVIKLPPGQVPTQQLLPSEKTSLQMTGFLDVRDPSWYGVSPLVGLPAEFDDPTCFDPHGEEPGLRSWGNNLMPPVLEWDERAQFNWLTPLYKAMVVKWLDERVHDAIDEGFMVDVTSSRFKEGAVPDSAVAKPYQDLPPGYVCKYGPVYWNFTVTVPPKDTISRDLLPRALTVSQLMQELEGRAAAPKAKAKMLRDMKKKKAAEKQKMKAESEWEKEEAARKEAIKKAMEEQQSAGLAAKGADIQVALAQMVKARGEQKAACEMRAAADAKAAAAAIQDEGNGPTDVDKGDARKHRAHKHSHATKAPKNDPATEAQKDARLSKTRKEEAVAANRKHNAGLGKTPEDIQNARLELIRKAAEVEKEGNRKLRVKAAEAAEKRAEEQQSQLDAMFKLGAKSKEEAETWMNDPMALLTVEIKAKKAAKKAAKVQKKADAAEALQKSADIITKTETTTVGNVNKADMKDDDPEKVQIPKVGSVNEASIHDDSKTTETEKFGSINKASINEDSKTMEAPKVGSVNKASIDEEPKTENENVGNVTKANTNDDVSKTAEVQKVDKVTMTHPNITDTEMLESKHAREAITKTNNIAEATTEAMDMKNATKATEEMSARGDTTEKEVESTKTTEVAQPVKTSDGATNEGCSKCNKYVALFELMTRAFTQIKNDGNDIDGDEKLCSVERVIDTMEKGIAEILKTSEPVKADESEIEPKIAIATKPTDKDLSAEEAIPTVTTKSTNEDRHAEEADLTNSTSAKEANEAIHLIEFDMKEVAKSRDATMVMESTRSKNGKMDENAGAKEAKEEKDDTSSKDLKKMNESEGSKEGQKAKEPVNESAVEEVKTGSSVEEMKAEPSVDVAKNGAPIEKAKKAKAIKKAETKVVSKFMSGKFRAGKPVFAASMRGRLGGPCEAAGPGNPFEPKVNMYIRPARETDLQQVSELYGHYVRNTVSAIEFYPPPIGEWSLKLEEADRDSRPFMVAVLKKTKRDAFKEVLRDFERPRPKKGPRNGWQPPTENRRGNNRNMALECEEKVIGFAFSDRFSFRDTIFHQTLELMIYTHKDYLHQGVMRNLMDRVLQAQDENYQSFRGTDLDIKEDKNHHWYLRGLGCARKTVISLFYVRGKEDTFKWQKEVLEKVFEFHQASLLVNIGLKDEKP